MARSFAVFVSTLAAVSAQAQEVQTSKAAETTKVAVAPESGEQAIVLASRSTPELRTSPLAGSTRSSPSDGGVEAGTMTRAAATGADCSVVEIYLAGRAPVVRSYAAPPPRPQGAQSKSRGRPPYVKSIAQCGQQYIVQIWSAPKDAWVIKEARLEGPDGEELQVNALRVRAGRRRDINVIVAEAPPGVSVSQLTLHLTGQDGRVAKLDEVELP